MRSSARIGLVAVALVATTSLTGCRDIERHLAEMGLLHVAPAAEPAARPAPRKVRRKPAVNRSITTGSIVKPGDRIRQFCAQRHIQFQSGSLKETDAEKLRNNELCRQEYKG